MAVKIKEWAVEDRPREKLLSRGIISLSDAELIAIIIGSGSMAETAVELARRILLQAQNNLNILGKYSVEDLKRFKGIGEAKAISIVAALELGRRRKKEDAPDRFQVQTSADIFELMQTRFADLPHEEFWVILLNRSNRVIDEIRISQGGVSGTVTDIRLILKPAIEKLASGIILCHNHPSGNKKPSDNDIQITQKVKEAARYMDIVVLDHLILCEKDYCSLADDGLL